MNGPPDLLLLSGRLGLDDDGWPLRPLLDRLETRGISARVICLANDNGSRPDSRFVEYPSLGNRWLKPLALRHLLRELAVERPRILHVIHGSMVDVALTLAETWERPYLQTVYDFEEVARGLRLSRRWCRGIVAVSEELSRSLVSQLGMSAELIRVVPSGISLHPPAPRSSVWSVPVIGTAGLPVAGSGFTCFLEAARLVLATGREVEFLIASQGEDAVDLRRHARAMNIGDRVTIADFQVVGPRIWTVLDLYCQPSLVPSSGRTLALALAQGVPSVASRVQGLKELIEPGFTGFLVSPGQPDDLASTLISMMDDPERARALGMQAKVSIRLRFDPDREADQLADLYRRHGCLETGSQRPVA